MFGQRTLMIEVRNLVRRYGDFAAVDDVSFTIQPGEVVGLLGHNGAGKTTIMKMLTGYLEPSSGQVTVGGMNVAEQRQAAQAEMGYLPESLPIYPDMTVTEYLSFAATMRGLTAAEVVPQAIAGTGLEEKALQRIETLSRGYKQRVGVAQAILHQPGYLILDEPSNGLDPNQIQHMRDLIRGLAEHATIILSTHIMQEVSAVCDRAIIIRSGKIAIDERLDDLRKSSSVTLDCAEAADVQTALSPLSCVITAQQDSSSRWRIDVSGDVAAATAEIVRGLVAAAIPIYAISPAVRDLEAIFREVNEQPAGHAQEAAHAA